MLALPCIHTPVTVNPCSLVYTTHITLPYVLALSCYQHIIVSYVLSLLCIPHISKYHTFFLSLVYLHITVFAFLPLTSRLPLSCTYTTHHMIVFTATQTHLSKCYFFHSHRHSHRHVCSLMYLPVQKHTNCYH